MDYETLLAARRGDTIIGRIRALKPGDTLNVSALGISRSTPQQLQKGIQPMVREGSDR